MDSTRGNSSLQERRLTRAVHHVSDHWFPVNEHLLSEIREEVNRAKDQRVVPDIVGQIRSDFSLFFHCLRELSALIHPSEREMMQQDPVSFLEQQSLDNLKSIFDDDNEGISTLSFDSASKSQLARVHEMIVSSSAAETLAESYGIDEHAAFSASVMRQLGLTLIAWNYPGIYEEVVGNLQAGDVLEVQLSQRLGFSPHLLAIRVLHSWGFSESYCAQFGLEDTAAYIDEELHAMKADTLAELCQIGEILARAHHPEIYPSAKNDWMDAERAITERLGPNGMKKIQERCEENFEVYSTFMPEVFTYGLAELYEIPAAVIEEAADPENVERNPFLPCCSPTVARAIRKLYRTIDTATEASITIRLFADDVVPSGRFSGGCVYTADPSIMMLIPQLSFGEMALRRCEGIDYSMVLSNADMISLAYQSAEPIVEYKQTESGTIMTGIAGMFGGMQRVGVFYLEIPEMIADFEKDEQVLHFQALRHLLSDCLRCT